jgi:acetate kinase
MKILVLNAGSSSQKSCLYELPPDALPDHPPHPIWETLIDWTKSVECGSLTVKANGAKVEISIPAGDRPGGIIQMLQTLIQGETQVLSDLSDIAIVGHRVVHGGTHYSQATRITSDVKAAIAELIPLAPNHNPAHLEGITAIEQSLGDIPQVAVFDTAFHSQMPLAAATYPIPYEWFAKGIRRYGFHGISHEYCAHRAAQLLNRPLSDLKLVICHLGNGCSLSAVHNGISINTTMGFTPLEGLMMGTRSGSIDPAILIYLMQNEGMDADRLNNLLNKESGIKGIFGETADLRPVLQGVEDGNERAILTLEMYVHRLRSHLGAMMATLGGVDAIIFTAGVGENAVLIREKACENFEFIGLKFDHDKNTARPMDCDIALPDSLVRVLVIHTEEDWAIAQACWRELQRSD